MGNIVNSLFVFVCSPRRIRAVKKSEKRLCDADRLCYLYTYRRTNHETPTNQTTSHNTTMKMKTYAAYAPTKTGKMVAIATTDATSKEDAVRVLSRFASCVDVRTVTVKLDK